MTVNELKKMLENCNGNELVVMLDENGNALALDFVDCKPIDVIADNGNTDCVALYGVDANA